MKRNADIGFFTNPSILGEHITARPAVILENWRRQLFFPLAIVLELTDQNHPAACMVVHQGCKLRLIQQAMTAVRVGHAVGQFPAAAQLKDIAALVKPADGAQGVFQGDQHRFSG